MTTSIINLPISRWPRVTSSLRLEYVGLFIIILRYRFLLFLYWQNKISPWEKLWHGSLYRNYVIIMSVKMMIITKVLYKMFKLERNDLSQAAWRSSDEKSTVIVKLSFSFLSQKSLLDHAYAYIGFPLEIVFTTVYDETFIFPYLMSHIIWTISYGPYSIDHIVWTLSFWEYDRNPIFAVSRFFTINTRAATASRLEPKIINCWSFAGSNAVLCLLSVPLPSSVSFRSSTCSL